MKETYLIANAAHPIITTDRIGDEMLLYNIGAEKQPLVFEMFSMITAKRITEDTLSRELSGGQKVVLMVCLALVSPAARLRFLDLEHALDADKLLAIKSLIAESGKQVRYGSEA